MSRNCSAQRKAKSVPDGYEPQANKMSVQLTMRMIPGSRKEAHPQPERVEPRPQPVVFEERHRFQQQQNPTPQFLTLHSLPNENVYEYQETIKRETKLNLNSVIHNIQEKRQKQEEHTVHTSNLIK
jgi:hypothetical protein